MEGGGLALAGRPELPGVLPDVIRAGGLIHPQRLSGRAMESCEGTCGMQEIFPGTGLSCGSLPQDTCVLDNCISPVFRQEGKTNDQQNLLVMTSGEREIIIKIFFLDPFEG